ncbi:MAG: CHRD domain-containing protein [Pseudonocardiaceae bacterium]
MQFKKGSRTLGRVGVCLAFVSSILVFTGPASAAEKLATSYEYGHDQFTVYLNGDEARYGGDRDGSGVARLDFDPENNRVCYVITWRRLEGAVTSFDLNMSPRRSDGPHWIEFFNNEHFDGDRNTVADCVRSSSRRIRDVMDEPYYYYLVVRTTAHESGAIRGQLR